MATLDYRDLRVWRESIEPTKLVYAITSSFPRSERFGLVPQMRRAAVSVAGNIAEGNARTSTREFLRFLSIAGGSLAELDTQFVIAAELGYADRDLISEARSRVNMAARVPKRLEQVLGARVK